MQAFKLLEYLTVEACEYNAIEGIVLFKQTYRLSHSLESEFTALLYFNADATFGECYEQLLKSGREIYLLISRPDTVGVAHVGRESALTVYRKVLALARKHGILGGIIVAKVNTFCYQIGVIPIRRKSCDVSRRIEKLIVQKYKHAILSDVDVGLHNDVFINTVCVVERFKCILWKLISAPSVSHNDRQFTVLK